MRRRARPPIWSAGWSRGLLSAVAEEWNGHTLEVQPMACELGFV